MTTHKLLLLLSFILCTLAVMDQLPLSPHHTSLSAADDFYVTCSEGEVAPDDALQALGGLEIFCGGETGDDYLTFTKRVTYYFHSAYVFVFAVQWNDKTSEATCDKKFVQDCISQIEAKCGKDGKGTAYTFPFPFRGCGKANRGDLI